MEYKKPKEQIAFDYSERISSHPTSREKSLGEKTGRVEKSNLLPRSFKRSQTGCHDAEGDRAANALG